MAAFSFLTQGFPLNGVLQKARAGYVRCDPAGRGGVDAGIWRRACGKARGRNICLADLVRHL